ncbi:MAG: c-type cytochrome [Desulfovibrionaceae bacterium]
MLGLSEGAWGKKGDVALGKNLYRMHCSSCHGHSGRGDGPMGRMLQCEPVDLTTLREDGVFPRQKVLDSLNHVRIPCGEMPDWSEVLSRADQEALVFFLETIQRR